MDGLTNEDRIQISWAACPRWATSHSSDLLDAVEQLGGSWAVILVDVQGSGAGGRRLAGNLMHLARQFLAQGLESETTVQAVHQHLFSFRQGKVGASIHVCVVDPLAGTANVCGLGPLVIGHRSDEQWSIRCLEAPAAGFERTVEVATTTNSLGRGHQIVLANDGIAHHSQDLLALPVMQPGANGWISEASELLEAAIHRDSGRPRSDMAVALISHVAGDAASRALQAHVYIPVRRFRGDT